MWAEPGERGSQQARPAGRDDRKPHWVVSTGHEGLLRQDLCFSRTTLAELEGRVQVGDGGWAVEPATKAEPAEKGSSSL